MQDALLINQTHHMGLLACFHLPPIALRTAATFGLCMTKRQSRCGSQDGYHKSRVKILPIPRDGRCFRQSRSQLARLSPWQQGRNNHCQDTVFCRTQHVADRTDRYPLQKMVTQSLG